MSSVQVSFSPDVAVELGHEEAHRLIDALWAVSTTAGAVAAVGKIRHALLSGGDVIVGDMLEAGAMRTALEQAERLTPGLERLRAVSARPL